jgi:hypothetical protein
MWWVSGNWKGGGGRVPTVIEALRWKIFASTAPVQQLWYSQLRAPSSVILDVFLAAGSR